MTAPTQALLDRYAPHGRGALLPNCMPRAALAGEAPAQMTVIGWSGASHSHPGDLEVVGTAIADLLDQMPEVDLHVIGDSEDVTERLGLHRPAWASGWQPLGAYFSALRNVTVAIVPLQVSTFNMSKSAITGLAWAAAGVPFVASPTAEYEALAEEGAGIIAHTPADWEGVVAALLTDEAMRDEVRQRGRSVAERHLIEDHAECWVNAWETAVGNHRQRMQVTVLDPSR